MPLILLHTPLNHELHVAILVIGPDGRWSTWTTCVGRSLLAGAGSHHGSMGQGFLASRRNHAEEFTNPVVTASHVTVREVGDVVRREELANRVHVSLREKRRVGRLDPGSK